MPRVREPAFVILWAIAAVITLTAANSTYVQYVSSHPGYSDQVLTLVSKPPIWLATLNRPLLPVAVHLLQDPSVEDWARVTATLGAFFGIGMGTLAGTYLVLWIYGVAISAGGEAFGWNAVRVVKWFCLSVFVVYVLIGLWYLIQYRASLGAAILVRPLGAAAGLFCLAVVGFGLAGFIGYHAHAAGKEWMRRRKIG